MKGLTGTEIGKAVELLVAAGAAVGRVLRDDEAVGVKGGPRLPEDVALHEHLVIGAGVDGLVQELLVVVVVDVLVPEAAGGTSRALVLPEVVVVGDVQMAKVDVAEVRIVADQRGLPVVMEVVPRHRDPV